MLKYSFNDELNILNVKVTDYVNVSDIINHYKYLFENNSFPEKLNVLIDSGNAVFEVKPDEIKKVLKPLLKSINKYDHLHEAILVNNPYKTAIASLFKKKYINFKNYKFNVFSTEEAALNWLLI